MEDDNNKNNHSSDKDEDVSVWELYTKDIEKLPTYKASEQKPKDESSKNKPLKVIKKSTLPADKVSSNISQKSVKRTPQKASDIDKRTQTRLKRGQFPIEARIDLHGLYQKDAKARLFRFLEISYHQNLRCVLVITGKGKLILEGETIDEKTPGVIRRNFKEWLKEEPLNHMVLRAERAQIKDGGDGAFYVLLRKNR